MTLTGYEISRAYDVPPWLVDGTIPRPRLARVRWALRRVRPQLVWPVDAERTLEA